MQTLLAHSLQPVSSIVVYRIVDRRNVGPLTTVRGENAAGASHTDGKVAKRHSKGALSYLVLQCCRKLPAAGEGRPCPHEFHCSRIISALPDAQAWPASRQSCCNRLRNDTVVHAIS
jgi:cobyrinic acid a,c-diamide synthase